MTGLTTKAIATAWNAQFARAGRTPWMVHALMAGDKEVAARFAHYYVRFHGLPRRSRRAMWRRGSEGPAGCAFMKGLRDLVTPPGVEHSGLLSHLARNTPAAAQADAHASRDEHPESPR